MDAFDQSYWRWLHSCNGSWSRCALDQLPHSLRRETAANGFGSSRQLVQRRKIPSKARAVGRPSKILKHSFGDKGHVGQVGGLRIFSSTRRHDVKLVVVMNETLGARQEHVRLNAMDLNMYSGVKHVFMKYSRSRQAFQRPTSIGRAPVEVDAFWTGRGRGNGNKGRGTGKEEQRNRTGKKGQGKRGQ